MPPELKVHFTKVVSLRDELKSAPLPLPEDKLEQLTNILADVDATPAYKTHFANTQNAIADHIADHSGFLLMMDRFAQMDEAARIAWLQAQVNKLAEIQSACGITIPPAIIKVEHWGEDDDLARLGFDPDEDGAESNIYMNMDVGQNSCCAISALSTVLHEQWHQFNNILARESKFGRMPENHPLYHEARYFEAQWETSAFVTISPAYHTQLDERFATAFGNGVKNFLQGLKDRFLAPQGTPRPA